MPKMLLVNSRSVTMLQKGSCIYLEKKKSSEGSNEPVHPPSLVLAVAFCHYQFQIIQPFFK